MKWISDLMKECLKIKAEVMKISRDELMTTPIGLNIVQGLAPAISADPSTVCLVITCPELPNNKLGSELLNMIPSDVGVVFLAALKRSTLMELSMIMAQSGMPPLIMTDGRHLTINAQGPSVPEVHDEIWDRFQELLKKDGFPTSWEIIINNEDKIVYDVKMSREAETQHAIRDTSIGQDDLTDLHIMLEASQSVDQFLAMLDGKPYRKPRRKKGT
jgi:hypothetical protein